MNVNIKTEYILYAVIIIVAVVGVVGREWVRNRKINDLNEQIELLTETANIQKSQIDEMTARLKAEKAERESVETYCTNVEAIMHKSEGLNHEIIETVIKDEESRDWYNSPVPDELCELLHERLCDRPCGSYKD
jgi:uncharacterized membrane protein YcjF (UPF0283 family)